MLICGVGCPFATRNSQRSIIKYNNLDIDEVLIDAVNKMLVNKSISFLYQYITLYTNILSNNNNLLNHSKAA